MHSWFILQGPKNLSALERELRSVEARIFR